MKVFNLKSKNIIDPESEMHYGFYTTLKNQHYPHQHDFFEVFFVIEGQVFLYANNRESALEEGSLVLIRPNEVHEKRCNGNCQYINIAFPRKTINDLFNYLGEGFSKNLLIKPAFPPYVILTKIHRNIVRTKFERLHTIPASDKKAVRTELRILLMELFTKYFTVYNQNFRAALPVWLETVINEMNEKNNFVKGVAAITELSGKSHAYLCRMFRKYLNITPVEFVNDLKLNYAVNLLAHTDFDIIAVSLESGFENLSHFYHVFKRKFGISPKEYRKENNRDQSTL